MSPEAAAAGLPAAGSRNAFVGLLIGGSFLQPFINLPVAFTTFALLGLGVGLMDQADRQHRTESGPAGVLPPPTVAAGLATRTSL